jgi:hypothetical protein
MSQNIDTIWFQLQLNTTGNSTYPKVAVQWFNQALSSIKVRAWLTVKCFEIATFG